MTTVPKSDTPPPANNAKTLTLSGSAGLYVRPTSGGAPQAGNPAGTPGPTAGPGVIPDSATAYRPPMPSAPSFGGYQVGADVGSGATIIAGQPDATGHPDSDLSGGGTVGDSGNQPSGGPIRTDFPKSDDLP
jgi:hypothetical protein